MSIDYMQDINLFLGFSEMLHKANKESGNQIDRKQQRQLMTAYTKACNKHQLVVINKQHRPLAIVGGTVFAAVGGSINRYMELVANKLGRELTLRETNFIRPQYQQLIARQRKEGEVVSNTGPNGKLHFNGDPNLWNRLMNNNSDKLKASILASVTTGKTKASNMDWRMTFDFNIERKALKARLKLPKSHKRYVEHAEYNRLLKVLQLKNDDVQAWIKAGAVALRDKHDNSGSIHVTNNIKGSMDTGTGGKRFTQDGYRFSEHENEGTSRQLQPGQLDAELEELERDELKAGIKTTLATSFITDKDYTDISFNQIELVRYCHALHTMAGNP